MTTILVKWLVLALAVFLVGNFLPGIHIADYMTALWVALMLGIANVVIRPILLLITFPINLLTLGLFTFVVNGFLFWLATKFVANFTIDGFWTAVLGAFIVSIITMVLDRLILGSDGKIGGE